MVTCDCYVKGFRKCFCGAVKDGFVAEGATIHIPLLLKDSVEAPSQFRKEINMMTDAEKRAMRDSVRGMPLWQAAKLPIYDDFRGMTLGSLPAEQYYAICDGADGTRSVEPTQENINRLGDALAARQAYERDLQTAHQTSQPVNDNRHGSRHVVRDGRALSQLSDSERAREQMIHDLNNAYRN